MVPHEATVLMAASADRPAPRTEAHATVAASGDAAAALALLKTAVAEEAANILRLPAFQGLRTVSYPFDSVAAQKTYGLAAFDRIDRIVDVFPAAEKEMVRAMISESLRAVISQTLCKTKDGSGRVAAHEIMIGTPAIRNLIRENKIAQMYSSIQTGNSVGMQTLDQCLTELVRRDVISSGEARAKAKVPESFAV